MTNELVIANSGGVAAAGASTLLPSLVERAGGADRLAWDEDF
ncbi:hypothetical protein [Paludisphaera borealis]|nr:hypothetical protein [Paludisphaera borealis]